MSTSVPQSTLPSPTQTVTELPPSRRASNATVEEEAASTKKKQQLATPAEPATSSEKPDLVAPGPSAASPYPGTGTQDDPYVVGWLPGELEDPYNWKTSYKWFQVAITAIDTLCIAFASSAYSGAARPMIIEFGISQELFIVGVSLYVVGFGAGPLCWAPLSEMYGRRPVFILSYGVFTLFHIGGACAQNIQTVLITRFFAGLFGSAPLTNSGGTIADMFSARERGTASAFFALAPFLGPVLGPIVGGFSAASGWRNTFWTMFAFAAVTYLFSLAFVPETFAPALLRAKAKRLQKEADGSVYYVSKFDKANTKTKKEILKTSLTRPFVLLFTEPIVLLLSIWVAVVYGTLYLFFTAFPVVFQEGHGWSPGVGGLAFLGIGVGMCFGVALSPVNAKIYDRAVAKSSDGRAPPESRLPFAMIGGCLLPIGLFWFAGTSNPSVHWILPIIAGAPFGCGMLFIFLSVINYLIDVYLLYAASALAANAVLRSLLGAVFPLFAGKLYHNLGVLWAGILVAFLSFICVPLPFLFYLYGPKIRARSTFAMVLPPPTPAPATATPAAAAPDHEKHAPAEPLTELTAEEPEYGPEAGMQEQRERDAELARRTSGDRVV